MKTHNIIDKNTRDISDKLLHKNGHMILHPYKYWEQFTHPEIQLFCHKNARYGLPTIELIEFLKNEINDDEDNTIEIGAGAGDLGGYAGIKMTDSKLQKYDLIKDMYSSMNSPTIKYPDLVEEIDAESAIKKYKPNIVIASWVTSYTSVYKANGCVYGVKENLFINDIKKYIFIGNKNTHGNKKILQYKHREIKVPFNISRATCPEGNVIWIWENE